MTTPEDKTIVQLNKDLTDRKISAAELARGYLENIQKDDKDFNAYLEVYDDVIEQAERADIAIENGYVSPLTGIPIAVKDNILVHGKRASAGSKILENYVASYDATVVEKLKQNRSVFLGRTNQDEFAMGSSTENSAYGVTKNPHDTARVPGGSSGGSAASVAYRGALAALGSDTGGSVRQPASFCGVVGLKPTYGAVSRHGLIALGSSLDQIGTFTNSVVDCELLYSAISGHDGLDSTSSEGHSPKKNKIKVGVPRHFLAEGVDEDVMSNFEKSLRVLEGKGYQVRDMELPTVKHALAAYYVILPAEASTNLARYDGVRYGLHKGGSDVIDDYFESRGEGFGKEVRRRILLGTYVLSAGYYDSYYAKAIDVRNVISAEYELAYESVDVIMTPTTATPAFKIGEKTDPVSMYLSDLFTVPQNITGMPALSIPYGVAEREGKSLPLGVQVTGPNWSEETLFQVGKDIMNES
jgi:aspartyl-tRNA(Asn)/glutamyl-tRNA(Gln) amidotransferase subunit A